MRSKVLTKGAYDPKTYEFNSSFRPWDGEDPLGIHTTSEMLQYLRENRHVELDARVIAMRKRSDGSIVARPKKISKANFVEAFNKDIGRSVKLREDFGGGLGSGFFSPNGSMGSTVVGQDFTPLLGGPFYKNLYFYQDYIRMHAEAFFAKNNDPFGSAIIGITRDFVIGTGYEMQCDQTDKAGKIAMAVWKSFEEANDLQEQLDLACTEQSTYGEIMFWKLPGNQANITYRLGPGDTRPIGMIPRVRLIDPSNIVEIVTYPEDITRPLFYVWLQPTQYQIYNGGLPGGAGNQTNSGSGVAPIQPSLKFIYRQIPANEMLHFKINCMSNEKRGRSDLFPIFNYLKRLRDAVDYAMISLEKVSAWSIDTTIEGDQTDIDAYITDQGQLGTIPPPGSEFIHSKGIQRQYLGNQHSGAHTSDAFQWCLSMISAGSGIPTNWFGTHLSGGSTRASALVATEPAVKKMEKRREKMKQILRALWKYCMDEAGLPDVSCNVVFPELISQDRDAKLKSLLLCEQARWFKPERAATIAAKEMGATDYSYSEELKDIEQQLPEIPMPLADPGALNPPTSMDPAQSGPGAQGGGNEGFGKAAAMRGVSSEDKVQVKAEDTTL